MVGVFVAFIRVVYRRMIYMSLPGSCQLPALSNTYRNLPFLQAAIRNPGQPESCHGTGWLPALSNTYRNLPFLSAAGQIQGHKTTVIPSCRDGE